MEDVMDALAVEPASEPMVESFSLLPNVAV